jgi:hypothetical protein
MTQVKGSTLIRVSTPTKEKLDNLRAPGQSYDGILIQLLDLVEQIGFGRLADRLGLLRPTEGLPLPKKSGRGRWKKRQLMEQVKGKSKEEAGDQ